MVHGVGLGLWVQVLVKVENKCEMDGCWWWLEVVEGRDGGRKLGDGVGWM